MTPAIETQALGHRYPGRRGPVEALRAISLTVAPGEFFGLFGPNGAGKTTLIRILTTLVTPTEGAAFVAGCEVTRQAAQVRAHIGVVFSNENAFHGRLSGRHNLEFFAALQNLPARAARRRAAELLEFFGLDRAAEAPVQTYSTGMRQKLNVARALLHNPPIIFLDEPTKGMDALGAERLRELLAAELVRRQGKTILLTTHDLQEMEALCQRVAILEAGELRAIGAPADLIRAATPTIIYRLEVVGASTGLEPALREVPAVRSITAVAQTPLSTVFDLTFHGAEVAALWPALAARHLQVKRFGPRDDGLVTVLKTVVAGEGPEQADAV